MIELIIKGAPRSTKYLFSSFSFTIYLFSVKIPLLFLIALLSGRLMLYRVPAPGH